MSLIIAGPPIAATPDASTTLPTRAHLGESGIVLSGDGGRVLDPGGCWWSLTSSLWGSATPREQTGDRAEAHGQWDATRFYGSRSITLTGLCHAPDHAALHDAERRLRAIVSLRGFRYRATEPGYDGVAQVRQGGEVLFTEMSPTLATYSIVLYAPDPLIWSNVEQSTDPIRFPFVTGGLTFPLTHPYAFASTVFGGTARVENPGTEPAGMTLRVDGPANDVSLSLSGGGLAAPLTLRLSNPNGVLLRTGEWLLVDTEVHRVLLNGESSRRSWAYVQGAGWPMIPAGAVAESAAELAINGTGYGSASRVTATWRPARI